MQVKVNKNTFLIGLGIVSDMNIVNTTPAQIALGDGSTVDLPIYEFTGDFETLRKQLHLTLDQLIDQWAKDDQ